MYITLVMVQSVDGKTTYKTDPHIYSWTSPEDQKHFTTLIAQSSLIIMGRKTYEVAKPMMKHAPGRLRIVVTSTPKQFESQQIPGQLEFTSQQPTELISRLEQQGYTQALLVGGANVNTAFFKDNLIDELVLTIEPYIFGQGNNFVGEIDKKISLVLKTMEKLNNQGTILLHYQVKKS